MLGVLREGDELLEINGIALIGKTTDEIIRLMVTYSLLSTCTCTCTCIYIVHIGVESLS